MIFASVFCILTLLASKLQVSNPSTVADSCSTQTGFSTGDDAALLDQLGRSGGASFPACRNRQPVFKARVSCSRRIDAMACVDPVSRLTAQRALCKHDSFLAYDPPADPQ